MKRESKMMWVCEEKSERAKSKSKGDGGKRNKGEGYRERGNEKRKMKVW